MIDYFTIALTHLLMAYIVFRLLTRDDLDQEPAAAERGESTGANSDDSDRPTEVSDA